MKNYLKKIAAVVSAAAMAVTFLSACKTNDAASGDVKTATIWMETGSAKAFWQRKIDEFNETKGKEIGVKINFDAKTDSSYGQALDVAIQSNQLPDFFSQGDLQKMVELDRIAPISDLPGMEEFLNVYKDQMRPKSNILNDKIYSIPTGMTVRGLIYNKDMFKAAGIVDENGEAKPPRTFAEFREDAKRLTDASKNQYGVVFPVKWQAWVESDIVTLAQSNSGRPVYDPEKGVYDYSILEPIVQTIMDIKADGSVYPGAEGLDNDPARARFAEGGIGMKISYSFDVGVLNEQFPAKCDWGVAPLPVEDESHSYKQMAYVDKSVQLSKNGLDNLGAEKAAEILKWLYSTDMIKDLYKEGMSIPCEWDMVKDVELGDNAPQGWKEFCELSAISLTTPLQMPVNVDGKKKISEAIVHEVWTGERDIKSVLDEQTKIYNDGILWPRFLEL